jgi:DNA mismatch repair ATPase MutS
MPHPPDAELLRHALFARLLNHTFTPMATRLLRMNILAPVTVQSSIDMRLDAVDGTRSNLHLYVTYILLLPQTLFALKIGLEISGMH